MLAAKKRVYNLTCSRRVAVRSERIVRVHCVKSARQLVDVGLNDDAVVEGDRGVTDDVVVHWVNWLKVAENKLIPLWVLLLPRCLNLTPIILCRVVIADMQHWLTIAQLMDEGFNDSVFVVIHFDWGLFDDVHNGLV